MTFFKTASSGVQAGVRAERKANTFRLYPTSEQAQQMVQTAGACRFVEVG